MTQADAPEKLYAHESAAAHMVAEVPRATADTPVTAVMEALRGRRFRSADTVFVTDGAEHLEGIVRINDLLSAPGGRSIGEIMEPEHEAVRLEDDQERIALLAMDKEMIAVPVVNAKGQLLGAVPPEALLRILRTEHMEDLQRLAGISPPPETPLLALDAPLYERVRRRLPWLVFGLFASSVVTLLMAGFEEALAANVTVAFFVPALVYIAGAIGAQAVSVAVRGLSAQAVPIGALMRGELVIGASIGGVLGIIAFVLVFAVFGDTALSLAFALAVFAGGTLSAIVGFVLPWAFRFAGSDPALGSGPICTIVQDVASLLIYLLMVRALVA